MLSQKDSREKVTIKIPRRLYEEVKELIADTGFNSATEFTVYVLRDIVAGGKLQKHESLKTEEIEIVRKRLRALGYIP